MPIRARVLRKLLPGTSASKSITILNAPIVRSFIIHKEASYSAPMQVPFTNGRHLSVVRIPLTPVTYAITVKTSRGYISSASMRIYILCSEPVQHTANAYTPNIDGNNDYFYLAGTGVKGVKLLQIYCRWGQVLYSKSNFTVNEKRFGWDGSLNGMNQPAGTYNCLVELTCYTDETYIVHGTAELLRQVLTPK